MLLLFAPALASQTAPLNASASVSHCKLDCGCKTRGSWGSSVLIGCSHANRNSWGHNGGSWGRKVIYDGQLRSSELACKQTAILTRNRGLSSLVLKHTANRLPSCVRKQNFKWQLLRNTIRHGSLFLQFTSIEETGFPSNEQFIDNRSH